MITVTTKDGMIYLDVPFSLNYLPKMINGYKWDHTLKTWKYPLTPFVAKEIDSILRFNVTNYEADTGFQDYLNQGKNIAIFNNIKTAENLEPIPITRTQPWQHQLRAYWYAYKLHSCMLSMAMGTGKSKVVVDLIQNRYHKRVLIFCPKSVGEVWKRQFDTHFLMSKNYEIINLTGVEKLLTGKDKAKAIKESGGKACLSVVLLNYHAILDDGIYNTIKDDTFDFIILDESHNIKAPSGAISKRISQLRNIIPYRICLTGTPMPHSPLDLYAQYRFLDPGIFGTSITRFRAQYCVERQAGSGYSFVAGWRNMDDFNQKFYSIAYRVDNEVLDLPEYVEQVQYHYMPKDTLKYYNEVDEMFEITLKDKEIQYEYLIVVMNKLRQICNGFLIDKEIHWLDNDKAKLLVETIENIGKESIVIFYHFKSDYTAISKALDKSKITYTTLSNWSGWQDGKDNAQCILVQIQSGGAGIDLTRAKYCIYYTLDYSLGNFEQSKARVHRPGQAKTVNYIYLITKDSIEEKIYNALIHRKNFIDELMKEVKK